MDYSSIIFGCEGMKLTKSERSFFRDAKPWAFILFSRNLGTPDQIKNLCIELRECVGRNAPILIDQEGGRVARLKSPTWLEWLPPLEQMQRVKPEDTHKAMYLRYRLIAHELRLLGIDVNCAPMVDIPSLFSHEIITNRCYGGNPKTVSEMGRACADGLLSGGVLPVLKHIPGHGRGLCDSHFELPIIDTPSNTLETIDFEPFRSLSDLPIAMTAHIIYSSFDPNFCATISPIMIEVIRKNIGFDGLLMTDDISMEAMDGSLSSRAFASLNAGCDVVLHCNGKMKNMIEIMKEIPTLSTKSKLRAKNAEDLRSDPDNFDFNKGCNDFASLM
ncbi:beta-N-acetylhexosaminidase [Amylibacter sp.]|nr:beta-N-acetylhexosaminidase [Amylibacter sp.]